MPSYQSVSPAVAANTPSHPPVAPADAAGGADNLFTFHVTLHATATVAGQMADEARNTVGIDLRNAIAEDPETETENGVKIRFDRIDVADVANSHAILEVLHQYANDLLYPPSADSRERRLARVNALLASMSEGA